MRMLTHDKGSVQVAANDDTLVLISHDFVQICCLHCGGLKNGFVLYIPNMAWEEYLIKQKLLKEQARCTCGQEAKP